MTIEADGDRRDISVLVAGKPDRMRRSLAIILRTMDLIDVIHFADDGPATLETVLNHHPTLVVLDADLPGRDVLSVLGKIKSDGSQSLCLVLANNNRQRNQAKSAGADATLLKGFPAAQLFDTIEGLLVTGERSDPPGPGPEAGKEG